MSTSAQAYPAAQIDQELRPNFGILLQPPLHRYRPHPWRGRRYGYEGGYQSGYPGYGPSYQQLPSGPGPYPDYPSRYRYGMPSVTVDCSDPSLGPNPISDAAAAVADDGVVYVRARGVACRETLYLDHPVVIAGEDSPAFSTNPAPSPVVITPPDGQPCVLVAQGVRRVELRGLQFKADKGGRESCIQGWSSEVALVRDEVDYTGDASAVYVSGGHFVARESRIEAHTYDAAVLIDDAQLDMFKVRVRGETTGIEVALGPSESSIEQVGVITPRNGPAGSSGILVRAQRSGGSTLRIKNATICGWRVGIGLERAAKVEVRRTRICRSSYGVMSDGANFGVTESAIGADKIGVYVAAGDARINHNRIFDVFDDDDAIQTDNGSGLIESDNWVFSKYNCDHFKWDGHHSCKPLGQLPGAIRDEAAFDRDNNIGWDVDGYDQGYTRDGPVAYFDKPKPTKPKRKELHLFDFR